MPWAVAAVKEVERGEGGVANLVWRAVCDWALGTRHGTEDSMFEDEEVEDENEPDEEDAGVPEAVLPVPCGASIGAGLTDLAGLCTCAQGGQGRVPRGLNCILRILAASTLKSVHQHAQRWGATWGATHSLLRLA